MWLLLLILAVITYFVVKSNAAPITRTPIWILWLVLMAPATLWTIWAMIYGPDAPLPALLLLGPFLICPLLYWWLVQKGRIVPDKQAQATAAPNPDNDLGTEQKSSEPAPRPIDAAEEKSLRDCFPWGVYYLQQLDYRPQAILCRGKLQVAPEMAYERVKGNVEDAFGDRFLVLFQESLQGQPFFALVPNPAQAKEDNTNNAEKLHKPWLALTLLLLTGFTTTMVGAEMAGLTPEKLQAGIQTLTVGLPYSLAILTILGCHELSHYGAAVHYKIRTTLPYFIPIPFFLGTFGAFIQMKSPVPHRKALFDVAIAGPLGGLVVGLPILWWGLTQSTVAAMPDNTSLLRFDALDYRFSLLMTLISKAALGSQLGPNTVLDLHPLAIAGYIGLIVTALNLMPFGQLDGGHIIHAMLGQRAAIVTGQITRVVMVLLSFIRSDFFIWAIILLLMPVGDQPALNDVSELDDRRDLLGIVAIAILILILLPVPPPVAQWLQI
ncbi:site-2 protease family protein [Synechocystis salina LEGE 06155]|nr:site-2 protease family protein [Synechocystis salina LEGE 06155]